MIYDISPVNNYQGNNSSTEFEFDFYIENEDQLAVYLFDKNNVKYLLKNNQDYSINEIKNKNGSFITFPLEISNHQVLADGEKLSIELNLKACQLTCYGNSSSLNFSALENSFDYLTRLIQILKRKIELCLKVEECSESTPEDFLNDLNKTKLTASEYANSAQLHKDEAKLYADNANISAQCAKNSYDSAKSIEETILKFENIQNKIDDKFLNKVDLNFDNAIPSDEFVSKAISWIMPDHSGRINIASYPYTVPDNGWIIGYSNSNQDGSLVLYLGEKAIAKEASGYCDVQVPVYKNQTLSASTTKISEYQLYFYPMKGAS